MKTLACDLRFCLSYDLKWVTEQSSFLVNGKPVLVYLISSMFKSVGLTCIRKDKVYMAYLNSEEFWEEASAVTLGTPGNLLFSVAKSEPLNYTNRQVYLFYKAQ